MEHDVKVAVSGDQKELIIRAGKAPDVREKNPLAINGTLDAVLIFLKNRYAPNIKENGLEYNTHILVDLEKGSISLVVEENNELSDQVKGMLSLTKDITEFEINDGRYETPEELAEFIRMRKHLFASPLEYTGVFTSLKSFTAKVNQEISQMSDDKGNYEMKRQQAVEHNVPKSFKLQVSIFKGQPKQIFEVEILVNKNLAVTMYSAELIQIMDEQGKKLVEDVVAEIRQIAPEIVIINQ